MPYEIIRRKEGEESQKQEIRHGNVQISINNWGHLCIREFDEPTNSEHLLVFDRDTTQKLIDFIFDIRSTYEFKKLLAAIVEKRSELPF